MYSLWSGMSFLSSMIGKTYPSVVAPLYLEMIFSITGDTGTSTSWCVFLRLVLIVLLRVSSEYFSLMTSHGAKNEWNMNMQKSRYSSTSLRFLYCGVSLDKSALMNRLSCSCVNMSGVFIVCAVSFGIIFRKLEVSYLNQ